MTDLNIYHIATILLSIWIFFKDIMPHLFLRPEISVKPVIREFDVRKNRDGEVRWKNKTLGFQIKNMGRREVEKCRVSAKIESLKEMIDFEYVSWKSRIPAEDKDKIYLHEGDRDSFSRKIYSQWETFEQYIPKQSIGTEYVDAMLFIEDDERKGGYLITRDHKYDVKFRSEKYILTLQFDADNSKWKYFLHLSSWKELRIESADC